MTTISFWQCNLCGTKVDISSNVRGVEIIGYTLKFKYPNEAFAHLCEACVERLTYALVRTEAPTLTAPKGMGQS